MHLTLRVLPFYYFAILFYHVFCTSCTGKVDILCLSIFQFFATLCLLLFVQQSTEKGQAYFMCHHYMLYLLF